MGKTKNGGRRRLEMVNTNDISLGTITIQAFDETRIDYKKWAVPKLVSGIRCYALFPPPGIVGADEVDLLEVDSVSASDLSQGRLWATDIAQSIHYE